MRKVVWAIKPFPGVDLAEAMKLASASTTPIRQMFRMQRTAGHLEIGLVNSNQYEFWFFGEGTLKIPPGADGLVLAMHKDSAEAAEMRSAMADWEGMVEVDLAGNSRITSFK